MILAWAILATVLLGLSAWLNVKVVGKSVELDDQREDLVDQIEQSLDMLDEIYGRIDHHSKTPVLSDEPVVQEVVRDLKLARNTILAIASKVVGYGNPPGEKDTDEG